MEHFTMKSFFSKSIIIAISLIVTTTLLSISIATIITTKADSPALTYSIVIDPGHGGVDDGCIGKKTKVTEKQLNLEVSLKLKKILEANNIKCTLTRKNDAGLYKEYNSGYKKEDMQKRKEIIEKSNPSLVISVHMNSFTSSKQRGAQVFYGENNPLSEKASKCIQSFLATDLEESNKSSAVADYYILKCTNHPTVLIECGYLSNETDEKLLQEDDYQEKIAMAVYKGIVAFLSIKNEVEV